MKKLNVLSIMLASLFVLSTVSAIGYIIWSNTVTVTSTESLVLTYNINEVTEDWINATLIATLTPTNTGSVTFYNVTSNSFIKSVPLNSGVARLTIITLDGMRYNCSYQMP
jgi:hypothetical protein